MLDAVDAGRHGQPQLVRCHVHQILAGALRDLIVHLFLEQREPGFADEAERHTVVTPCFNCNCAASSTISA